MYKYFYFIAIVLFTACLDKLDKHDFRTAYRTCDNNLTVELYRVYGGGAHGGDLLSAYLTDSTDFRIYLGTFDDAADGIYCKCHGDTVFVNEMSAETGIRKVVKTRVLYVKELKKNKKFE